ncbi:MAG: ion transporter [Spirochaetales bacterium]|nr:ion transporter [Spirochaetales bacterium]
MKTREHRKLHQFREKLYIIIFESDTNSGKLFDVLLLVFIILSVLAVLLNSVDKLRQDYESFFLFVEWFFTIIFTLEYIIRIFCARNRFKYIRSFFGIIDFLAILPSYILRFVAGMPAFTFIRVFRLLRIFTIFKLGRFIGQANFLLNALKSGFRKIIVFTGSVLVIVVIMGSLMFLVEGPENGFVNIPKSMYWAIVTLTTVGYGDLAPKTVLGQTIASVIMLLGYGIIAVPTGILSAEIAISFKSREGTRVCSGCGKSCLDEEAVFCKYCGEKLKKE